MDNKFILSREDWVKIGQYAGFIKEAGKRDSYGNRIGLNDKYILRMRPMPSDPEKPYFCGGGSLHAPEMVFLPSEAAQVTGLQLENSGYDWTRSWDAVPVNRAAGDSLLKKPLQASKIPNTQSVNPDARDFAVELGTGGKSIPSSIKKSINKEIHAMGNYHQQIPISEIFSILRKYHVVPLQEDGAVWSGFVTSQGDCGSEKATQGPMQFDLATLEGAEYVCSSNWLIMSACTMPSGRMEIVAYVS